VEAQKQRFEEDPYELIAWQLTVRFHFPIEQIRKMPWKDVIWHYAAAQKELEQSGAK